MNLDVFVTQTLLSIMKGVADAREAAQEYGGHVNPGWVKYPSSAGPGSGHDDAARVPRLVKFDVAIAASDADARSAGGKVGFSVLVAGGDLVTKSETLTTSRIEFSVPVILPSSAS